MPKATLDLNDTKRFELKSLPEGFVVLKRMTYGQKLQRQEMAMQMSLSGSSEKDFGGALQMSQQAVAEFEFASCVVEHNLEDGEGTTLDFKNPINVRTLDPMVGEEIATYIDKMNTFVESDEAKN